MRRRDFGAVTSVFAALAGLALVGGVLARRRLRRNRAGRGDGGMSDDDVRQIEERGWIMREEEDEPLDLEAIREAERRFWEPTWDEPEER